MKILIVGVGVIGTIYGRELARAGNEVVHLVRPERLDELRREGLRVTGLDQRKRSAIDDVYRPGFIADASRFDGDLVFVSTGPQRLDGVLPLAATLAERVPVVFCQNLMFDGVERIGRALPPGRWFLAYPFMAGGGRSERGIEAVLFANPLVHTAIGEADGSVTPRLKEFARALSGAGLRPYVCRRMKDYLQGHLVWAAANLGAYGLAGSYERFAEPTAIRSMYKAMREGFRVCEKAGTRPYSVSPTRYYSLPLFLLVPFSVALYRQPALRTMFEGHLRHAPDEMTAMLGNVLAEAKRRGVPVPRLESYTV